LSSSHSHGPPYSSVHTLSLHDALPISAGSQHVTILAGESDLVETAEQVAAEHSRDTNDALGERETVVVPCRSPVQLLAALAVHRSEEHTSELQSRFDLVCRLLLEKKK